MLWIIVLAGGSGTRLAEEARRRYGYPRPKQYCDFDGTGTLLERTLRRALRHVPPARVIVVTVRDHRQEADEVLRDLPPVGRVEQPRARDTTPGILLPLLEVRSQDPDATVVLLPSDHHVGDEDMFADAIDDALAMVAINPNAIALLASETTRTEDGYGWVVPGGPADQRWPQVVRFQEKPDLRDVEVLRLRGALVNTFVLAGRVDALAGVVAQAVPAWWNALSLARGADEAIRTAFDQLPPSSFSRDVLERVPGSLRIVKLPADAGWSDVGTPDRLSRVTTEAIRSLRPTEPPEPPSVRPIDRWPSRAARPRRTATVERG